MIIIQIINDIFNIIGRGYVITVDKDDGYKINQKVKIHIDGYTVTTATIIGIEMARGATGILKQRGLLLKGEKLEEVCKGMLINPIQ